MTNANIDLPAIRRTLKLTQTQLAEMAGVNLSTVWRWENEGVPTRGPAKAFIDRLAIDATKRSRTRANA
ncbi:helix-turn-helix domain-containing protein [Ochrobactrum chromiisoli]|uniref:Helix-turn-helix transcriptional regulator n=1 Tax=Ochrobactrum chromiisoli TaxID=2993941 RepID=A0ABT3QUR2_9HYPH|nr:helix-turn-helix transcriptional regulator [Ochrobactrum chromiisoli]MCX2699372.1 helix-turn-helix transcriptional regulator [Ochrobactrum chromiisoli]